MDEIDSLEASKTNAATALSIATGVIGTGFMAGSVFAVTAEPPIIWLCVLMAIPGFLGWILPYFVYQKTKRKKAQKVQPYIEEKHDEIYKICENGECSGRELWQVL